MAPPAPPSDAHSRRSPELFLCVVGWTLLIAAGLVLAVRYGSLPDSVPLYRVAWNDTPLAGPKTPVTVGRIAAMGLGQVGAASVMARAAWHDDGWRRFWTWATVAAGAKTFFECLGFAASADGVFVALTGGVVVAFLVAAARWWRRGALTGTVAVDLVPKVVLVLSLALWALAAVLGRLV